MKKTKILMIIITFLISFPIHFIYDKYPSFITSILFPVNESIWEHMKIFSTSILLSSIIEYIIYKNNNIKYNNFILGIPITIIFGIIFYLIIYLLINIFIPHNFIITIILMFITYIICQIISYKIQNMKKIINQKEIGLTLLLIILIIFTHLTYYPLNNSIFIDPITKKYSITKKG